jgi:hypothetical protein
MTLIERIKALGPEEYARRVDALVAEGLDHSDAEAVVDAELIQESPSREAAGYAGARAPGGQRA